MSCFLVWSPSLCSPKSAETSCKSTKLSFRSQFRSRFTRKSPCSAEPDHQPNADLTNYLSTPYRHGFISNVESETFPVGINENIVRKISEKKKEPQWVLDFRLGAFRAWREMNEPHWGYLDYPALNFDKMSMYSEPKKKPKLGSLDEADPELLRTFQKLGIPLEEQKRLANVAVDAVFDSVSIATTHQQELKEYGILFCSMSEAVHQYPDLIRKYLSSVVPVRDNFFACLNSAVFSDGTFVYIPPGVKCPMELSTYFRINTQHAGQFERTLIVADKDASVSYLEGCTAPAFSDSQLHAAVVELIALDNASIKYSTVQNWYAGDEQGRGGIYNFVTKRGKCAGRGSKISWTQVETGSAITWKYPSCILAGEGSVGEFYSVALTTNRQQADTGTKMIHAAPNTRSIILSKGVSAGQSVNTYRGEVVMTPAAKGAKNSTQCDSLLIGNRSQANTLPHVRVENSSSVCEHEASTSRLSDQQLFYLRQRGLDPEAAVGLLISGFCKSVIRELPLEFASEVRQLLSLKLENAVG